MQLVVTEKPSVAQAISHVIGAKERKDGYMEGNGFLVSWCVGHLVELAQPEMYSEAWKKWSYESLPMIPEQWQHEVKKETATQYKILKNLMHDTRVESVVCATDAGREGELIFRFVYQMAGCTKPVKRLWISSMEDAAIREGFANLCPDSDYDALYQSALCRAKADWLVGINATRLFSVLYHKTLTVGRVQTPTLKMLVDRDAKILRFQKEKYYTVGIQSGSLKADSGRIADAETANSLKEKCTGAVAVCTSVKREKKTEQPPKLYDLTTLQREANRLFGFTAKQTLDYAQQLYEKKLLTYPRTDSQYLTEDMGQTAQHLVSDLPELLPFAQGLDLTPEVGRILNSKKVSDHHAIIPTSEFVKQGFTGLAESECKLMYGDFQLTKHFVEGQFANQMQRQVFVFKSVINQVLGLNTLIEQRFHLCEHPMFQTFTKTLGNPLTTHFPTHVKPDGQARQLWERTVFQRRILIIVGNFDGAYGSRNGVDIGRIVQVLIRGKQLR